jgi:hypothetical protein
LGVYAGQNLRRRLCGIGAIAFAVVAVSAGVALAWAPVKGATYTGYYDGSGMSSPAVSFQVSADGTQVYNASAYAGDEDVTPGTATISRWGYFTVTTPVQPPGPNPPGYVTIKGRFTLFGRARGTVSFNGQTPEYWVATP